MLGRPVLRRRPATYADLEALPSHLVGEIIAGELIASPRPAPAHTESASMIGILLGPPFRIGRGGGPGGWWIEDEPELHTRIDGPEDVLVPDLAGWRRERMPHLPTTTWFDVVPDWVCEVLSPSTEAIDRDLKLPRYARMNVRHAWLVDPLLNKVEIYCRADEPAWQLVATHVGNVTVRAEPFDAVELDFSLLWER
jgi:Uma2 family endonuclease